MDEGTGTGFDSLPFELVAYVFGFIDARGLFPSCFLISKTCLKAVNDETTWEARCVRAGVFQKDESLGSWLQTYRGKLSVNM